MNNWQVDNSKMWIINKCLKNKIHTDKMNQQQQINAVTAKNLCKLQNAEEQITESTMKQKSKDFL